MQTLERQQPTEEDSMASYLKDVKRYPLLTREEEKRFARASRAGSAAAREKLINSNLRFVINIARQYRHRGMPLVDLVGEGNIGLLKAVERFDPERGFHFTTYAVWWIRQSILKALEAQSRTIRLPAHAASVVERIGWAHTELRERLLRNPTSTEVATFLGMREQQVSAMLTVSRDVLSLESPAYHDGAPVHLGDTVESGDPRTPEDEALAQVLADDINQVLATLSKRESDIIQSRFGLNGRRRLTLTELGRRSRLTKERVRQIEKRALQRLRASLRMQLLEAYLD